MNTHELLALLAATFPDTGLPARDRRSGVERRQKDEPVTQHRRSHPRRVSVDTSLIGTVPIQLRQDSPDPPQMNRSDTYQIATSLVSQYNNVIDDSKYPATYVSSDTGVVTVDANGLVTATPSSSGTATVTKYQAGWTIVFTFTVIPPVGPVVDHISVSPTSIGLVDGGGTITSTAQPEDSSNQTITGRTLTCTSDTPSVATAGAVSVAEPIHSSVITPVSVGSAILTWEDAAAAKTKTLSVVVASAPSSTTPWMTVDFSAYSTIDELLADGGPGKTWQAASLPGIGGKQASGEVSNTNQMSLGTDGGPPGGSSNYLRYTYPQKLNNCSDYTINTFLRFPSTTIEVWYEFWVRFSSNFRTPNTTASPACTSTAGLKYLLGRIHPRSGSTATRFDFILGTGDGTKISANFSGNGFGTGSGGGQSGGTNANTDYFDGTWHRWRGRQRVDTTCAITNGTTGGVAGTGHYVLYFETTPLLINLNKAFAAQDCYGIALNANLNQGPSQTQTCDFGLIKLWRVNPGWTETGF